MYELPTSEGIISVQVTSCLYDTVFSLLWESAILESLKGWRYPLKTKTSSSDISWRVIAILQIG